MTIINKKLRAYYALPTALVLSATLTGCYENKAKIEYTSYGVPHITAQNYQSLAFGQAYAHAQENMCTLAEQIIDVRAERALTFGAGTNDSNTNKDFGTLALGVYQQSETYLQETMSDEQKSILTGYANGFNQAVADKEGVNNYPYPCRGAEWIPEITATDLHAYHLKLALFASGSALAGQIVSAAPPVQNVSLSEELEAVTKSNEGLGSNGWALGRDKTESGNGMLLSNPHFPWSGSLRFIESHLKIPGELNVTGVSFVGVPGVLMGFNEHLAWTHTVSQSKRFSIYNLILDPSDPTRYKYGEGFRDMTSADYSVSVTNEDGSVSEVQKTLYSSHYGPMIGWVPNGTALTFRDANVENHNMVSQWFAMGVAKTIEEFDAAFETYQGIPWVNTIATDDKGNAFFIDGSRAPNLNPTAEYLINNFVSYDPTGKAYWREGKGELIMDGSQPVFEWLDAGNTPTPGVVPYEKSPKALRSDYVFNANSSHWLNNVQEPLEGYSIVFGPEKTIRSPRTRMNATMLEEVSANGISGADGKFNLEELKNVVTSERGLSSEILKDEVISRCTGVSDITLADETVIDISSACSILSNWDGLYRNDSYGAHVFREFLKNYDVGGERVLSPTLFATPFDAQQPVATPTGLSPMSVDATPNDDPVLQSLASTVQHLASVNIPLEAKLGDLQYHLKNNEKISIPGGATIDGVFNINTSGGSKVASYGYPVFHGASWVMALEFTEKGPKADAFLTYSQSHDPESEHYADQTRLFSEGNWRPVVFTDEAIEEDLVETIKLDTY